MGSNDEIPEDILLFLDSCIDSIEQLRVLFFLQSDPNRSWTIAEITQELRSADTSIAKRIEDLYSRQVLQRLPELGDRHKFTPSSPEVARVVQKLVELNQIKPYRIIEAVYSKSNKTLRLFADAFNFRGNKS